MFAGTAIKTVENKGPFHQEYINNFYRSFLASKQLLPHFNSYFRSFAQSEIFDITFS
jgi:hypothetical protein